MNNPIKETLQMYIDQGEIAGAAVRVRQKGEVIAEESLGWADIEARRPVTPKTVFGLCSMSKPVTAVLTMKLVEEGRLSLEEPVAALLPEFSPYPQMTVRMLLDHTSGILTGESGTTFVPVETDDLATHTARIARHPLEFAPGEGVGYSGLGAFDVLGRIIELKSGARFEDYLARTLTGPLGMADTGFAPDAEQRARMSRLYEYTPGEPLKDVTDENQLRAWVDARRVRHVSGSAGMVGTLDDYDRFVQMLLGEGELDGRRVLRAETVRQMHAPSAANGLECCPGGHWGLGMMILEDNVRAGRALYDGTFGWSGAHGTHFYVAPQQELCMTLMVSRSNIDGAGSYVSIATERAIWKMLGN